VLRVILAVVALVLAGALADRMFAGDSRSNPSTPSGSTGAMTHPREGAMYHRPYTSTR
jgi:hypothetical protein